MGGIFSTPKAPAVPTTDAALSRPEEDARLARVDAIKRMRRGRAGTVHTGSRGLLALRALSDQRKSLLGE